MKNYKRIISITLAICLCLSLACISFAGEPTGARSLFGNDDRVVVTSTSGRNLSIAKLYINYEDGSYGYGTGFLLSSTKVATAGHCLLTKNDDGDTIEATKITLYFGCSGTNSNHSHTYRTVVNCNSSNTIVADGWTGDHSSGVATQNDYGLIILSNPFVNTGNYFELDTISNPDGVSASIIGYEHHNLNTAFSNWQLLSGTGTLLDPADYYKLETHIDAMKGQSGSPVINNSTGKVVGIFTYGAGNGSQMENDNSTYVNKATRITSSVINFYNSY